MSEPETFPFRYKVIAALGCAGLAGGLTWAGLLLDYETMLPRLGRKPWGQPDDKYYLGIVIFLFVVGPSLLHAIWGFLKEITSMSESIARGEEFEQFDAKKKNAEPKKWRLKADALFDFALLLLAPQAWFFLTDRMVATTWKQFSIDAGWVLLWMVTLFAFVLPPMVVIDWVLSKWNAHQAALD